MSEFQFKILRSEEEIADHLDEWRRLAINPMSHPEVVLRLCRNDPNIITPFIPILVDEQGRIACMFGSRIEKAYIGRDNYLPIPKMRVRKLIIPMGGIFGRKAPQNVARLLESTLEALEREKVDALEMPHIDTDDPLHRALEDSSAGRYHSAFGLNEEHWRIELEEDFDKQMLLLGRSTRSTLRHNLNRFDRLYENRFKIKVYTRVDEVEEALEICEKIDDHSYHRELGVGVKADRRTIAVYQGLAAQGGLEISILLIDDEPVAFINNAVIKELRFGTHMGFNQNFCKYPLGTILLFKKIEQYIADGKREIFDFGIGKSNYKSRLCTTMSISEQREIRTRKAIYRPSYLYMSSVFMIGHVAKMILTKMNLEDSIRDRIRARQRRLIRKGA